MALQESIYNDLKNAIKERIAIKTSYLKILIGELQRQTKKELTDNEVISIVKKLVNYENENPSPNKGYLDLLYTYLPKQATEEEIKAWIKGNIDFSQFKNKMQAMKPIMQHFGTTIDGNTVKKILEE